MVLSLAYTYSPEELHIVLIDASGRSLTDLTELKHVIAWVNGEDGFAKHIAHLQNELAERRKEEGKNSPEILFVFDDYDLATDAMGINEEILLSLGKNIRQDSNLGFHFLISLLASTRLHSDSLINQLKLLRVGISLGNAETLEALGAHITSAMRKEQLPQGRGYFFARSGISLVQFANPDKKNKKGNAIEDVVSNKWRDFEQARWSNPASEEQIEKVKNASAADIGAVQSKNIQHDPNTSTGYMDVDESVRLYIEQQNQLRKEKDNGRN